PRREAVAERIRIVDLLPADGSDEVAAPQPRLCRRPALIHRGNERTRRARQAEALRDIAGDLLKPRTKPGPTHGRPAVARRFDDDAHHGRGNGETDAVAAAGTGEDRRIDADELAPHVDERPARVAGVDRGIRLDERLEVADADLGAGKRRDDSLRHRL